MNAQSLFSYFRNYLILFSIHLLLLPYSQAATPSQPKSIHDLFGKIETSDYEKIPELWFKHYFKIGNENFLVFAYSTKIFNELGVYQDCHACGVDISFITYKQSGNKWTIVTKQKKVTIAGVFGAVNTSKPGELVLSPAHIALFLDVADTGGGYTFGGKRVFDFSDNHWHHRGYIQTHGDNSGACETDADNDPSADRNLYPIEVCWRFTGTIKVRPNQNSRFPDLLVISKGTQEGKDRRHVIPAKNQVYKFDGKVYDIPKTKQ